MFVLKGFFVVALIAFVVGEGDDKDKNHSDKRNKHHETIKKCLGDTRKLKECCDFPKDESMLEDPECKQHLEGVEKMKGKEKWKAYSCYSECMAIKNGELVDGEIVVSKLKTDVTVFLMENNATDLIDLSNESITLCNDKFDAKMEQWAKWKEMNGKNESDDDKKDEKKCSLAPGFIGMCIMGKVVRECPESRRVNSEECEAARNNATTVEECMK